MPAQVRCQDCPVLVGGPLDLAPKQGSPPTLVAAPPHHPWPFRPVLGLPFEEKAACVLKLWDKAEKAAEGGEGVFLKRTDSEDPGHLGDQGHAFLCLCSQPGNSPGCTSPPSPPYTLATLSWGNSTLSWAQCPCRRNEMSSSSGCPHLLDVLPHPPVSLNSFQESL